MMSTFSSKTELGERPQSAGSHFVWLSLSSDEGEEYDFWNIVEVCACRRLMRVERLCVWLKGRSWSAGVGSSAEGKRRSRVRV